MQSVAQIGNLRGFYSLVISMPNNPTRDRLGLKSFYRRNLPHIQPVNSTFFLTFRLTGSVPEHVLRRMAEERKLLKQAEESAAELNLRLGKLARRHFAMLESWLDKASTGPIWLKKASIARIIAEALNHRDGKMYTLDAFTIMPNHVHAVFTPLESKGTPQSLSSIMHSLKRITARRGNLILKRKGAFWEHESFDHYVRNRAEWKRIIKYVIENPVKAGLVRDWKDWEWTYLRSPSFEGAS
ncbi:MAG: REP-associated tyrosine transposase [Blastocatellia bacterium]|jgi:REP element-mobilizing transposase RayT|nr:REP-associated tyrosine transposase [Blastocatellia bacterium]